VFFLEKNYSGIDFLVTSIRIWPPWALSFSTLAITKERPALPEHPRVELSSYWNFRRVCLDWYFLLQKFFWDKSLLYSNLGKGFSFG
jgi:hypothetical protein